MMQIRPIIARNPADNDTSWNSALRNALFYDDERLFKRVYLKKQGGTLTMSKIVFCFTSDIGKDAQPSTQEVRNPL